MIEYGIANMTKPGEPDSGDRFLVKTSPKGVLLAVVDGAGHGPKAAEAAEAAAAVMEENAGPDVATLMALCHKRLRSTRGAVVSMAFLDFRAETLTWLGVGNITGLLHSGYPGAAYRPTFLLVRGGMVGCRLPPLVTSSFPFKAGHTLVFATDGIGRAFSEGVPWGAPPQRIADQMMAQYASGNDDALVVVVRYVGGSSEP